MKRFSVLLLAAVMTLSMAGCSENADSDSKSGIIAAQLPKDDSIVGDVSVPDPGNAIKDSGDISEPDDDILIPATTEAQDLAKSDRSDYSFFLDAVDYTDPKAPIHYEGEILDDSVKQKIFYDLCTILNGNELSLEGEPVTTADDMVLTLKNADGDEYRISIGYIEYDYLMSDGTPVCFFTAPHSVLCFETDMDTIDDLWGLLGNAINSEENIIVTEGGDTLEVKIPEDAEKPEFPITYISVRSNFAWGRYVSGAFLDSRGYMYTFDLSKNLDEDVECNGFTDMVLKNLMKGNGVIKANGVCADVSYINESLKYAAKIGPDTEFNEKEVMMDYGQHTLYAVVDGECVMLESFGDVDKTSEDENVQSAISSYKQAFNT